MKVGTNDEQKCDKALTALKNVLDPEIGLNIVDLGLIYQIEFDEIEKKIDVEMTLTTPFCPMGESITLAVKRVLENAFTNSDIHVILNFDPPWSPERISEEGHIFLNQ